jgi:hypothetical protein
MLTNSTTALSNLVIFATLSSSVVNLTHEAENHLTPQNEASYGHEVVIADWKDNAFNSSFDYTIQNENSERVDTIVSFTENLLNNSKDIENEFVDIVNENFWDLV